MVQSNMDLAANTLLAAGASPAMLQALEEIPDFTPKIDALYINVGTLCSTVLLAMKVAAEVAVNHDKPWVFDPVAAVCSSFRLRACLNLLLFKPTVLL